MKKKVTLIQILSIIIVLAIIGIIVFPMLLGVVEIVRKNSAKASISKYIEEIQKRIIYEQVDNKEEDFVYESSKEDIKEDELQNQKPIIENENIPANKHTLNKNNINDDNKLEINDNNKPEIKDDKSENNENVIEQNYKLDSYIKLSSNNGNYMYPIVGTFEIIENNSDGILSCQSSDKEVATCTINGKKVIVTPGVKEGTTTLTIKTTGSSTYKDAQAAYVVITSKGVLSVTANNYEGTYDGKSHGITVSCSGATIKYGTEEGNYILDASPKYTEVGEYIVYYQIEKEGYKTVTGSKKVTINSLKEENVLPPLKDNLDIDTNNYEGIYDGESHGITVSCSGATIKYGTEEGNYILDVSPEYTEVGEYIVYYQIEKEGYKTVTGSKKVTINSLTADNVSYENDKVNNITNVKEALDYLNGKLN